jgi:ADP-ribosylation factor protein 1
MGIFFSQFCQKKSRILILGLDGAGKTTIIYKFKLDKYLTTVPTVGFNVETVKIKNTEMTIWDMGGQDKLRTLWKYYFENCDALVFVIDSTDTSRFNEVNEELFKILTDKNMTSLKFVLIFWNKVDCDASKHVTNFKDYININFKTKVYIQACSALRGTGIKEGFYKLYESLK